jgi:two-component system, NtrC family, response regulator AtoC
MKILLVDDDPGFRRALTLILEDAGYEVRTASDGVEGLERARRERPHLILTDVRMPRMGGLLLVERLREEGVHAPVIVMTAYGSMDLAVEALRLGAADYLAKPFGAPEALLALRKVEARFELHSGGDATPSAGAEGTAGDASGPESTASPGVPEGTDQEGGPPGDAPEGVRVFGALHVRSESMIRVGETARKVAGHPTSVMIQGPTGTGKELLARFLHDTSPRARGPFVPVNCGAIPGSLLESEFFGAKKGAYTGAERDRPGLFEAASGGTLFLDEVGELPEALQVKLLRVLQEGVVRRLGGEAETPVDVRIVAATNRDLEAEIAAARFREDLYYRLAVVTLEVPPLSERPEDLEFLVDHLLARHARRLGMEVPPVSEEARAALRAHDWPGNVRELENVLERALILAGEGGIGVEALPWAGAEEPTDAADPIGPAATEEPVEPDDAPAPPADLSVKRRGAELERELIRQALERTGGHRGQAAELLELSDRALRYKIREYGLEEGGAEEEG